MADNEKSKQSVVIHGNEFPIENSQSQLILSTDEAVVGEDIDDGILQQAFGDVSQPLPQNEVYKTENGENVTLIADGSVLTDVSGNVVGTINDDGNTYTLSSSLNLGESSLIDEGKCVDGLVTESEVSSKILPVSSIAGGVARSAELLTDELVTGKVANLPPTSNISTSQPLFVIRSSGNAVNSIDSASNSTTTDTVSPVVNYTPTTLSGLRTEAAPLGSSQNPIRIIQQGNQYTSTQQLNPDQLSQIMQVVQQQQAVRQAKQMGGTSVIYNPETQTKIVYRVINPADLHGKTSESSPASVKTLQIGASGRTYLGKKRGRKRKIDLIRTENDTEGPELSRKEKEEKKKNRSKTRSGRVSKPPRHMVKDYKQIHLVDWNEDYDDSDGGYSDYKASGDEDENAKKQQMEEEELDDYEKLKPRKFACKGCDRRYIGRGGLERHWTNFPDHRTFSKIAEDIAGTGKNELQEIPPDPEASNDSVSMVNGDQAGELAEGTVKASNRLEEREEDGESKEGGQGDGRQTPVNNNTSSKRQWGRNSRRFKLMDLLDRCPDEVVLEVALPRLASVCSAWHFLLAKAEVEKQALEESQREEGAEEEEDEGSEVKVKVNFSDVYQQYEEVRCKMKQLYSDCLAEQNTEKTRKPVGNQTTQQEAQTIVAEDATDTISFEFSTSESAASIGQQCGNYTMMSELPQHWTTLPIVPNYKPSQDRNVSQGPISLRKSKPKVYPGAVSEIPPLETNKKPRILGETKPMEESEIKAHLSAKKPPASRLKLWVKDENSGDEEEDFPFTGVKKKKETPASVRSDISGKKVVNGDVSVDNASGLKSLLLNRNTGTESEIRKPESIMKNELDVTSKANNSVVHTVAAATTTIKQPKPFLAIGDTIQASPKKVVLMRSKSTELTMKKTGSEEVNNGLVTEPLDSGKDIICNISSASGTVSEILSSEQSAIKPSAISSLISTADTSQQKELSHFNGNEATIVSTDFQNLQEGDQVSSETKLDHHSHLVTGLQDELATGNSVIAIQNTNGESYETYLQESCIIDNQEQHQATEDFGNNMMEIEDGVVVQNIIDSNNSVITLDTKSHNIPSDMTPFMTESQSDLQVASAQVSKENPSQLLADLTPDNNGLSVTSASLVDTQSDPSDAVAFHVIGQDTVGAERESELPAQIEPNQMLDGVQLIQTGDGIVLVKNDDGTFQIHSPHDQPIPLETVQALLNLTPP